jgi:hypothetical protein
MRNDTGTTADVNIKIPELHDSFVGHLPMGKKRVKGVPPVTLHMGGCWMLMSQASPGRAN